MRRALAAAMAMLAVAGCAHQTSRLCAPQAGDAAAIDQRIRGLFAALERDDAEAVRGVTSPSFYAYDVGKRFTAGELSALIRDAHGRGVQLNWNLGAIDTHVGCDMAWAAWENKGSAGVPPNVAPVTWLESAVLRRVDGGWRIDFLHSTRVPTAK